MGARAAGAVTGGQRIAGAVALLSGAATVLLAKTVAIVRFPSGLLPCVVVAVVASWFGVVHRGITRVIGISVAVLALLGALALLFRNDGWPYLVWLVVVVVIWHTASRMAFRVHVRRPAAEPPWRAVLFINPWSGDGKAAKVGLAEEGAKRGIRTVELHRGDDLERLVHDAVSTGRTRSRRRVVDGTQAICSGCPPTARPTRCGDDPGVRRQDRGGCRPGQSGRRRAAPVGRIAPAMVAGGPTRKGDKWPSSARG
jgi:hypothetical protein